MCGISGIVVPPGTPVPTEVLAAMNGTLARRGPDDEGYYVDEAGGCGLGHRRLSIIDLTGGHQPLATPDGLVQVIVNGEIYNFAGLRAELVARGHTFRTKSDSEVVAHGYAAWGRDVFQRLEGMFAAVVWDARRHQLILARDRMGKKPLYYAFVGPGRRTLIFGSELKALAMHPELDRSVGPTQLAAYLTYECLPDEEAIYESARKVSPGAALVFHRDTGRAEHFRFWKLSFQGAPSVPDFCRWSEEHIAEHLRGLITQATRDRLVSDVPLGVFLSGGIDSSLVTAAMARSVPARDIKTFSITFEDPSFDEGSYARLVSRHLGTDHHEQSLSPRVMIDILPEVADFMCEPIGDASVIPTYLLSRFTRETVTVALGGDGGDELFLGYPTFQADRVARQLDAVLPRAVEGRLGAALSGIAGLLPVSRKNFSLDFKIKRFAQGLGWAPDLRHQAWMGSFMPTELASVLDEDFRAKALARDPYAIVAGYRETSGARDAWDALVYQYLHLYLTGCVLVKVDRASMACGLEVRAPLLDTRVVEFAAALPGELKLKGLTTKYILKRAAWPWLPAEIIDRPKKGFGIPVAEWLRGPLRDMAFDLLSPARVRRDGYFDARVVTRLLEEHDRGDADHRKPLWTLLAFQLWHERYGPRGKRKAMEPTPLAERRETAVMRRETTASGPAV